MKRLIALVPVLPYPLDTGGNIRVFHTLRVLSQRFEVHVVTGAFGHYKDDPIEALIETSGVKSVVNFHDKSPSKRSRYDIWRGAPHGLHLNRVPGYCDLVRRVLSERPFDCALLECSYMAQYLPLIKGIPVYLSAENVESVKLRRWFKEEPAGTLTRIRQKVQYHLLARAEARALRTCRAVFVTSQQDEIFMRHISTRGEVVVSPNGVDLGYFTQRKRARLSRAPRVLFVGSLFYKPNIDAAVLLKDQIHPLVRETVPSVELHIVGNAAPRGSAGWNSPERNVFFHGHVPDVRPYFEDADVLVVPLSVGGGTRIKILEAMASGVPVVSTSIGAEGIAYTDGSDIVIADTVEELAQATCFLLGDAARARDIGQRGRALVEARYEWGQTLRPLRDTILAGCEGDDA